MKKFVCIFLLMFTTGYSFCQQKITRDKKKFIWPEDRPIDTNTAHLNELNAADRSKYPLKITMGYIEQPSCIPNNTVYKVKAVLQNTTNDTLKYIDWTCSHVIWDVNNPKLNVYQSDNGCGLICDNNYITTFEVPPHKSFEAELRVYHANGVVQDPIKFRIGIILQRVVTKEDNLKYFEYFHDLKSIAGQKQNIIWSNEILLEDKSDARYYKWILLVIAAVIVAAVILKRFFKSSNAS